MTLLVNVLLFSFVFVTKNYAKTDSVLKKIRKSTDQDVFWGLENFSKTTALLKQKCLRNIDLEALVDDALKYSISKIDPHSAYISDYGKISEAISGNFSGIGVSILNKSNEDEHLQIIDVIDDSPSQKAGILAGDKVVEIEGEKLKGLSSDEVISKIRGKKGSKLSLKILRGKNIIDFVVPREMISDKSSLGYYFTNHQIYFVSLKTFTETAPKQMRTLIEKINKNPKCKGLILDLRSNPGGIMESAVEIASLFIPKNSLVVSTKNRSNDVIGKYFTTQEPALKKNITIFVLLNNYTASAAEILAGALRHYSKTMEKDNSEPKPQVFLLGTSSFGKGSVQEVIPLSNNKALKITTMLYFLPNNKSVQEKGVKPDFTIMPMRKLSNEEKFINELFGKEKTMYHHISQKEVNAIINKELLEKNTAIDKITTKKINKLEEAKIKQGTDSKDQEDYEINDFGELLEKLNDEEKKEKLSENKTSLESKRKKSLAQDTYVQTSVNMINFLSMFKKQELKEAPKRKECKAILFKNFVFSNNLEMEKLE